MSKIPPKLRRAAKRFNLTGRQLETLALISSGLPWKAVADEMSVTPCAVYFHVQAICRKTESRNCISALLKIFLD